MVWKNARLRHEQIVVPEKQVRDKNFSVDSLNDMANSIREVGQLQPVVVQPVGDKYRLVFGERRLRALALAGHDEVDARIVDADLTPAQIIQMQLIENVARENLDPLNLACSIKDWMQESSCTATEVAAKLGLSNASVSKLLPLAELPPAIQAKIKDGTIPRSAGYDLSRIKDVGQQAALAAQIASGQLTRDGLSGIVRKGKGRKEAGTQPPSRIKAELAGGVTIIVTGTGINSLDELRVPVEQLLGKIRKLQAKGLALGTFCKLLHDEAMA